MPASIRHLILPAAGFGTRMRPVHPTLPKELLPLGGGRVIDFALLEAEDADIETVTVVLRQGKEDLRDYLENHPTRLKIRFVLQERQLGEGHALLRAGEEMEREPFAVLYPDNVGSPAPGILRQVCAAYEYAGKDTIALMRVAPEMAAGIGNSGRVDLGKPLQGGDHQAGLRPIRAFLPKGRGCFIPRFAGELRTCGLFVSLPHFFDATQTALEREFEGELTDGKVRRVLLERGASFVGVPLRGTVFDVGTPAGYTQLQCLLRT